MKSLFKIFKPLYPSYSSVVILLFRDLDGCCFVMAAIAIASLAVYFALSELGGMGFFRSQGSASLHPVFLLSGLRPFVVSSNAANSISLYSLSRSLACSPLRCFVLSDFAVKLIKMFCFEIQYFLIFLYNRFRSFRAW